MAIITANQFAKQAKTVRVQLEIDQKIRGLSLKKGDICELSLEEAKYLKSIERVKDAPLEKVEK